MPRRKRFALYWCTTPDGSENWFVVAASAASARRYHEREEGYARGEATAERVVALPESLLREDAWLDPDLNKWWRHAAWPSDAVLRACGAEIAPLVQDPLRDSMGVVCKVVRIGDRVFRAGDVVTKAFEQLGLRERPRLAVLKGR